MGSSVCFCHIKNPASSISRSPDFFPLFTHWFKNAKIFFSVAFLKYNYYFLEIFNTIHHPFMETVLPSTANNRIAANHSLLMWQGKTTVHTFFSWLCLKLLLLVPLHEVKGIFNYLPKKLFFFKPSTVYAENLYYVVIFYCFI